MKKTINLFLISVILSLYLVSANPFENIDFYWNAESLNDSSGLMNGTGSSSPEYISGIIGNAWNISDYLNQRIIFPHDKLLNTENNDWSWNFWVNPSSISEQRIIGKLDNSNNGYIIYLSAGKFQYYQDNGAVALDSGFSPLVSNWYMVTITKNSSHISFWVNGTYWGSVSSVALVNNTLNLTFGHNAYEGGNYMNGILDEVGFWNGKSLNESEIIELYNNSYGMTYQPSLPPIIDSEYPQFSNYIENPISNSSWNESTIYEFNTTITSTNTTSGIEFDGINYSLNQLGNVYSFYVTNLTNNTGYTYYYWSYGNGTSANYNTSSTFLYLVGEVPGIPEEPQPEVQESSGTAIFNILNSAGAGLGMFLIFLSQSLPILLIGIAMVGIIIVVGYTIAKVIKYSGKKGVKK